MRLTFGTRKIKQLTIILTIKKTNKTMNTIKIIVTSVMVLSAMYASANNSNKSNTADAPAPAVITTQSQPATSVNYKTSFIKDDEGRIINKIIYKDVNGSWCPLGAYSVYYGEEENVLTYAQWDKAHHRFTLNAQQQRFNSKDYPVLITESSIK